MDSLRRDGKWYLLAGLFLINIIILSIVFGDRSGVLTVAFLDVGQGDAIFIETANGRQVLIDGGPNAGVLAALGEVMPFYDRSIDVVIATHPDLDHIGGLPDVLTRYEVDLVIESGVESDTAVYKEFERIIEEKNIEKVLARKGMQLTLGGGVYLIFLFPDRDVSRMNPNDASIIAKLVYGDTSFLFTGDSPKKIEEYLVFVDSENLNVDVLKVGHHGSKTSSSEFFVGYTSPEYVVISSGADNRYGHPHKEVLDIFEGFGVPVFRTDLLGSVIMESDGRDIFIK